MHSYSFQMAGYLSANCGTFGNGLDLHNPPSMANAYSSGLFMSIGSPLVCGGNATRWNVCYFPKKGSTNATLAVYRKYPNNSLSTVAGSLINITVTTNTNSSYSCVNVSISQTFSVQQGDILVGCIPSQNGLRMAANISGASAYSYNSSQYCGASVNLIRSSQPSGLTLLISLGM